MSIGIRLKNKRGWSVVDSTSGFIIGFVDYNEYGAGVDDTTEYTELSGINCVEVCFPKDSGYNEIFTPHQSSRSSNSITFTHQNLNAEDASHCIILIGM